MTVVVGTELDVETFCLLFLPLGALGVVLFLGALLGAVLTVTVLGIDDCVLDLGDEVVDMDDSGTGAGDSVIGTDVEVVDVGTCAVTIPVDVGSI